MTLTQTAILTKQVIVISAVALVVGSISLIGYKVWYAYYLAHLPPVEEKPDTKFGLLPPPNFPKGNVSTSNFSYSLDTTTGGLPKVGVDPGFEKIVKVYFVTQTFATLLSSDRSENLAKKFDLLSPPDILSETKYKFEDKDKLLVVNLDNGNFSYSQQASASAALNRSNDEKLISDFKQTLANLGVLKDDLRTGKAKVVLLKVAGEKLTPTQLRQEAAFFQISLWPAPIDKKPILTADFNKSLVTATVLNDASTLTDYLSLDFTYYPIDTSTFATYSLKPTEAAFDDLKSGKGVVMVEPEKPQVSITSVSLGYYLPEDYSPYLQPIYVFEGPSFVAYVSAVSQ